jgi:large subunit ribosomal protein L21
MKYAVVQISNRQYKVHEGDLVKVEFLKQEPSIDVLAYAINGKTHIDTEYLKDVTVEATVESSALSRKIRVGRFKSKARYDKTNGHRQPYTIIKISKIKHAADKEEVKESIKEVEVKQEKVAKVAKVAKESKVKKAVKSTAKKEAKSAK